MRTPESDKRNQQACSKCGRMVGCDYRGRKHKCICYRRDGCKKIILEDYAFPSEREN